MYVSEHEVMESVNLQHSLQELGDSIRSSLGSRSDANMTVKWSDNVKLFIEELTHQDNAPSMSRQEAKVNGESLEGDLLLLKAAYAVSNANRRLSLSKLLDFQGNIRVFCRVRPYLPCEVQSESYPLVIIGSNEIKVSCPGEQSKIFKFDKVFPPEATQGDVFLDVQTILKSAVDGHNVCIFSYGQTGTGKTYTMEGNKSSPGIIPRALDHVFRDTSTDTTARYRLTFSMLEIYKGSLRDLLVSQPTKFTDPPAKSLNIHMSVGEYVEVENLTEYVIESAADALKFYRKGVRSRSTSTTTSNENSSRSHCLVRINILREAAQVNGKPPVSRLSKLWLIDLAGSERFFKTQAWGKPLQEGKAINVSLTALGDVISALQKKQPHIPYRNSKLTQILRDSLVNNSRVLMFVHPSPKEEDYGETICSLGFALRARGVQVGRNESPEPKTAKEALLRSKLQIFEGECYRLSRDIQALETSLRLNSKTEEAQQDDKKLMLLDMSRCNYNDSKIKPASSSLPRFMTQTFSSLSKRLVPGTADFEPIWPVEKIMKQQQQQMKKNAQLLPTGLNNRALVAVHGSSSFQSQGSSQKNSASSTKSLSATRRKSLGGEHTPPARAEFDSPRSSSSSASHHSHRYHSKSSSGFNSAGVQQQQRNVSRIQRRLTLECLSRVSVNI